MRRLAVSCDLFSGGQCRDWLAGLKTLDNRRVMLPCRYKPVCVATIDAFEPGSGSGIARGTICVLSNDRCIRCR